MNILFRHFNIDQEKEDYKTVISSIDKGVVFTGTNLWVLVFAIFIASLGLNVNSPAVIIGAMLVSPLMGPIMGMGLGMAINDLHMLKKAIKNYLMAALISLVTSTLYFAISPLNDAHSEILARTSPNIYDVLIAFFGGLAGMLALSSTQKGNVIPGVAIATALMPPLCTAGYGLATFQFTFFLGAFYLFLINTVFIALATLLTARMLRFPFKIIPEEIEKKRVTRIIWSLVILTLMPSIYFAYDLIVQNKFSKKAKIFIETEAIFPNDYLLSQEIDPAQRKIILTFGGEKIEPDEIEKVKSRMHIYELNDTELIIQQGFTNGQKIPVPGELADVNRLLHEKDKKIDSLNTELQTLIQNDEMTESLYQEIQVHYPETESILYTRGKLFPQDSVSAPIVLIKTRKKLQEKEMTRIEEWIRIRLKSSEIKVIFNT